MDLHAGQFLPAVRRSLPEFFLFAGGILWLIVRNKTSAKQRDNVLKSITKGDLI